MAIKSNAAEAIVPERPQSLKPLYLEAVSRVERLPWPGNLLRTPPVEVDISFSCI